MVSVPTHKTGDGDSQGGKLTRCGFNTMSVSPAISVLVVVVNKYFRIGILESRGNPDLVSVTPKFEAVSCAARIDGIHLHEQNGPAAAFIAAYYKARP